MTKTFLVSDTHFGHNNAYKFTNYDGTKMRPWDNAEEGDAAMVERWNSVVGDNDKVIHLGDVAIPRRGLKVLEQLKGRKVLVRGNHDIFKLKDYVSYFEDIQGSRKMNEFILSHIPLHPASVPHWAKANIHGHLHGNIVQRQVRSKWMPWRVTTEPDPRYVNVSVEHTDYTPIDFEEIRARFA